MDSKPVSQKVEKGRKEEKIKVTVSQEAHKHFGLPKVFSSMESNLSMVSPAELNMKVPVCTNVFIKWALKNRLGYIKFEDVCVAAHIADSVSEGDFVLLTVEPFTLGSLEQKHVLMFKKVKKNQLELDIFKLPETIWSMRRFIFRSPPYNMVS